MAVSQTTLEMNATVKIYGLDVKFTFVPFSKSRNKNQKNKSINWKAAIFYNGKEILSDLDYMQGIGYLPFNVSGRRTLDLNQRIESAIEHGAFFRENSNIFTIKLQPPQIADFMHCFLMDCDAINCPDFEDWADSVGYDRDSRAAEKIYNEATKNGLKFRACIGNKEFEQLIELFQNY